MFEHPCIPVWEMLTVSMRDVVVLTALCAKHRSWRLGEEGNCDSADEEMQLKAERSLRADSSAPFAS